MGKLKRKIAVVTGGAQGIGAAIVERFVHEGAVVAVVDRNKEKLEDITLKLGSDKVIPFISNVAEDGEVAETFSKIYRKLGAVHILVNNAGIIRDSFFHKMKKEDWDEVINVNLNSMFYTCQAVIPNMREQQYGKIVNISSVSSWGNMGQANYSASKAAVIGLTRTLAKENGSKNITVNAVAPGHIETEMTEKIPEKVIKTVVSLTPAGRMGKPGEIAAVVSFLASDDSSFINGECIHVNGGLFMA